MPKIDCHCEHCGANLKAPEEAIGKSAECPKCHRQTIVRVPAISEPETPPAKPPPLRKDNSTQFSRVNKRHLILVASCVVCLAVGYGIGSVAHRTAVEVVLTSGETRTLTRANAQDIIDEQGSLTADVVFRVCADSIRESSRRVAEQSENPALARIILKPMEAVADSLDQSRANMFDR